MLAAWRLIGNAVSVNHENLSGLTDLPPGGGGGAQRAGCKTILNGPQGSISYHMQWVSIYMLVPNAMEPEWFFLAGAVVALKGRLRL